MLLKTAEKHWHHVVCSCVMDWLWEIIDSGSERKICLAFIYFSRYNCYIPFMRFDLIMLTSLDSWLAFNDISNNGRPVIDGAFWFILNLVSELLSWIHINSEYRGEKSSIYIRLFLIRTCNKINSQILQNLSWNFSQIIYRYFSESFMLIFFLSNLTTGIFFREKKI